MLDLEHIQCQSRKVASGDLSSNQFDVPPTTYALTVAYQTNEVATETESITKSTATQKRAKLNEMKELPVGTSSSISVSTSAEAVEKPLELLQMYWKKNRWKQPKKK